MCLAGCEGGVAYHTLSPFENSNGINEAFVQKKTHNTVTNALPRPRKGPLQESCVLLMFSSEMLDVLHTWAGLHK